MKRFNQLFFMLLAACLTDLKPALAQVILPEVVTPVIMSNRDVNRVVCSTGDINDVYFSQEKGMTVVNDGRNAFVKFLIQQDGLKESHVTLRSELYVVCNASVYTLMITPKNVPAKTYHLSPGKSQDMRNNVALLGPLAEEERALYLTLAVFKEDLPDAFTEIKAPQQTWNLKIIENAGVVKSREIQVEGLGLNLSEYYVKAATHLQLQESQFLQPFFGRNIFAVTVEPRRLRPGQVARVLVVEKGIAP